MNKLWYIKTLEYYLTTKRNGILTHAIAWTNLENILIIENLNRKGTYCMIPCMRVPE